MLRIILRRLSMDEPPSSAYFPIRPRHTWVGGYSRRKWVLFFFFLSFSSNNQSRRLQLSTVRCVPQLFFRVIFLIWQPGLETLSTKESPPELTPVRKKEWRTCVSFRPLRLSSGSKHPHAAGAWNLQRFPGAKMAFRSRTCKICSQNKVTCNETVRRQTAIQFTRPKSKNNGLSYLLPTQIDVSYKNGIDFEVSSPKDVSLPRRSWPTVANIASQAEFFST
ncbi:hypothetical protein CCUS01_14063 [Colletotrichum cuscutae]|uniref:Uncharacterized protein n=1 Tax=Colletotrichum cuscutae TaxID=1209917 RepID=A0AAI9YAF9_9PEZI|nr:hypothetical protein CCUS01_14063 [Colletotrichum cuscutae]